MSMLLNVDCSSKHHSTFADIDIEANIALSRFYPRIILSFSVKYAYG